MIPQMMMLSLVAAIATPTLAQSAPARQGAQPVARSAFMQRVDRVFVAADANKDGQLTRAEIEANQARELAQMKANRLRQREAAFRQLDANKDGQLSLQEYNGRLAASNGKANATPVLTRLDTNKDGKVSLAENRVLIMSRFDRADANKNGVLEVTEQRAMNRR